MVLSSLAGDFGRVINLTWPDLQPPGPLPRKLAKKKGPAKRRFCALSVRAGCALSLDETPGSVCGAIQIRVARPSPLHVGMPAPTQPRLGPSSKPESGPAPGDAGPANTAIPAWVVGTLSLAEDGDSDAAPGRKKGAIWRARHVPRCFTSIGG